MLQDITVTIHTKTPEGWQMTTYRVKAMNGTAAMAIARERHG